MTLGVNLIMNTSKSASLKRIIALASHETTDRNTRSLESEWIITNGIGGYASGTLAGINTRRFHGWLIAALPAPHGRTMMLNQVAETLRIDDRIYQLTADNLSLATKTH